MSENTLNNGKQDFISHDNRFSIYQLKKGREYHSLRFSSLAELQNEAQQLRSDMHKIAAETEGIIVSASANHGYTESRKNR